MNPPPNILFMITHDTGIHLGCYGEQVKTPALDDLASKGVKFNNNFSTAPQCSPSRGSMLTGLPPHQNGLMGLVNRGWNLPENNLTLPELLTNAGYHTKLVGLQHEHGDRSTLGYVDPGTKWDAPFFSRRIAKKTVKFFDKIERGKVEEPFYCKVGFFETHRPFLTGRRKRPDPEDISVPDYLPDTEEVRKELCRFYGMLKEVDCRIGQVLEDLEKRSFAKNTLVIFTTDHGWAFPRAKCTLLDPGVHTALIMHWPGMIEGGRTVNELSSGVDLLPTLCSIARANMPGELGKRLEGMNVLPLASSKIVDHGEQVTPRERVFIELTHHDSGFNPMRGIRTKKWKYIRNFAPIGKKRFEIPRDIINHPSGKTYKLVNPNYHQERPLEELYDLVHDSMESNNLATDPSHLEILSALRDQLMAYLERTADPVLEGPVPEPKKRGKLIM
ncbi:sulfatase-like hydrolase/transferase [Candidatus Bathyarchaeota archaeon]|nr:sulfatase-like hydrolase/transferase [Candidatus Bathyarchaeota archaeon]